MDPRYHRLMVYQVLARSWRPQRFADLIGQEAVVQTLQNALSAGTLGHAYLFSGLRGVGKTTAARLLAKAVNCERGPTPEPCGECLSCREIAAGTSLDVIEIDGASNRKIDDVRELRELLRYRPSRDRFRVIIIDEVHMLTREAFNALLKSLEEPPSYILFIFATTERHKVPATILSRCQQLEFRPIGTRRIAEHLATIARAEDFTVTPEAALTIARAAEGSVRDALSLVDQLRAFSGDAIDEAAVAAVLGVPRSEQMAELVRLLAAGEAAAALGLLRDELRAGHDAVVLYQEVGRTLRLMVHMAADPGLEPDLTGGRREQLQAASAGLGIDALIRMLGLWVEQEPLLRDAMNRELALEVACLRLSRWPSVQRIEAFLTGDAGPGPLSSRGPAGGSRTDEPGGSPVAHTHPTGSPGEALSVALWQEHPRIAAIVDAASITLDGDVLRIDLRPEMGQLGRVLQAEEVMTMLETTARELFEGCRRVSVHVNGDEGIGGSNPTLKRRAGDDEDVADFVRIMGGEIVELRPDPPEEA